MEAVGLAVDAADVAVSLFGMLIAAVRYLLATVHQIELARVQEHTHEVLADLSHARADIKGMVAARVVREDSDRRRTGEP